MKRRTLIVSSLVIGCIFGPPVAGAIGALFWSPGSHWDPKWEAAEDILSQLSFAPPWSELDRVVPPLKCGDRLRHKRLTLEGATEGEENLLLAIDNLYEQRLRTKFGILALDSLHNLPAPILGALRSCINGTPASLFCTQYVLVRVGRATDLSLAAQKKLVDEAEDQRQTALCVIDPVN